MQDSKGFTLLELLVAAAVLGILIAGIYNTFEAQQRAYVIQSRVTEMNQRARIAIEIMSREIRNAAFNPTRIFSDGADAKIHLASANSLIFSQDIDGDGKISSPGEWLGFRYESTNQRIDKCTGSVDCNNWQPFVDGIQPLKFNYILADGTSTNNPAALENVRVVVIYLVSRRKTGFGGQNNSKTIASRIQIRNLDLR
jgi:prepilin-type N-terminal cleavage/methylation domain-containing protein